jgi:outer membrane cobalamin receptor
MRSSRFLCGFSAFVVVAAVWLVASPVRAQTATPAAPAPTVSASPSAPAVVTTGTIAGTILDAQQHGVPNTAVTIAGPATVRVFTDANGAFRAPGLPPGLYRIDVTKPGFTAAEQSDVAITAGDVVTVSLGLEAAQITSIRQIGHVSVSQRSDNAINTSTAGVSIVSAASAIQQGQLTLTRVLDQQPGVSIGVGTGFSGDGLANGASPLVTGVPSIRGGLPYETASLIDGHPISIGVYGTFNTAILSPYELQNIEIVKGPGNASSTNINYAIGGTENFVTLDPTRRPHEAFDAGIDQFGGQQFNVRSTGTLGRLGYALDYAAEGTQGPSRSYNSEDPLNLSTGALVNGQVACGSAASFGACFPSVVPTKTNFQAASNLTAPLLICCPKIGLESSSRHELVKLRYNFTPSTALTISYLGAQLRGSSLAANLFLFPSYFFGPPAAYASPKYPAGYPVFQNLQGPSELDNGANLYQADFHTAIGPATINARYFESADNVANLQYGAGATPGSATVTGALFGGVPLGPTDVTPTIFTGQQGTVTLQNAYVGTRTYDVLHGFTVEADVPSRRNLYSVSFDHVHTASSGDTQTSFGDTVLVYPGSGQSFTTILARGQFDIGSKATATLSNYATSYTDSYTQDAGATFTSSTHAYDVPRLALRFAPDSKTSLRASAGFSVAPPYIKLLTNQSAPQPDRTPPTLFTTTGNAGDIAPETSFGFDVGGDRSIAGTIVSLDVYETTLRNQFLSTTALTGTYTAAPGNPYGAIGNYPLYTTKTANLGHSRYEGLELSVRRSPVRGPGYKVTGYLQRAYAYDLPKGFYDTASGANTANLGIFANENFQATGQGYNGLGQTRIPYSGGYGEFNYTFRSSAFALFGATYYGANNGYNRPAFAVVNASFTQPLAKGVSLQASISNLTGAYSAFQYDIYGGTPTALRNGKLGYTAGNVIGPTNASLLIHVTL